MLYNNLGDFMFFIYDNINNYTDNDYQDMLNSLNVDDKKKITEIIRISDKKLSILSRFLLKSILSQKYHLDYNNIFFNEYNKPLIEGIFFNISHSYEYVVLAFSNNEIGIDIEKIRKVDLNIINGFCTDNEKDYILNSKDKYKSLFEIYTLKESYFKMLGTDLSNIKNVDLINNVKSNLNIKLIYDIPEYIISMTEKTGK